MFEVNQKTLAAALNISARQVRNLREQGMFPFIENTKKYDLTQCVHEYIEFKIKAETGKGTTLDREKEQAEHERYKKEYTYEKLKRFRKESHAAADVEEFLMNMLTGFKNHLLSLPAKIAPLVLNEPDINVIVNIIEKQVYEALDELSEYDPDKIDGDVNYCCDDEDGEDDVEENQY